MKYMPKSVVIAAVAIGVTNSSFAEVAISGPHPGNVSAQQALLLRQLYMLQLAQRVVLVMLTMVAVVTVVGVLV